MNTLLDIVEGGLEVLDLTHPMEYGIPRAPVHPEFRMNLVRRHGDTFRPDGTSASSEIIITGGHVGTHIDALAHFSLDGKLFGGVDAAEAQRSGKFSSRGADEIPVGLFRGVFLDVAAELGLDTLPGGYVITRADLIRTAENSAVTLQAGDVVMIRTGWSSNFGDVEAFRGFDSGCPGVDEDAAAWIADHKVSMTGSDTINYEVIPPGQGSKVLPVHRLLLVERGINIIEVANLDPLSGIGHSVFCLAVAPLNIVGATGSPARLLAFTGEPRFKVTP